MNLSEKFLKETQKLNVFATDEGWGKYYQGYKYAEDGKLKRMTQKEQDAYRKQEESKFLKIVDKYSKGLNKDIIAKVFADWSFNPVDTWNKVFYWSLLMIEGKTEQVEALAREENDDGVRRTYVLRDAARIARTAGFDGSKYCELSENLFEDSRAK